MGYYMSMVERSFKIKAEDKGKALEAIKAMFEPERLNKEGNGGSWGGGAKTETWYSWVDTKASLACKTLEDAIKEWGWELIVDEESGDVVDISYEENKIGQESLMFTAIAPYVEEGSFLHMNGEDGSQWRWYFEDGNMVEQTAAKIVWN